MASFPFRVRDARVGRRVVSAATPAPQRGNLVGVALLFVTAGSAGGDLLVSAVVMPFVRTLPWAGRASPVREGAAGVTREVQSELIVIVVRVLLVSTGHGCRLSRGHLSTYKRPPI